MKRKWVLVSIAIAVMIAASVIWWQSRPSRIERFYEPTPDEAKIAKEAQAIYKTLDMMPIETFDELEDAQAFFEQVPVQDPQPATIQIPAAVSETELAQAKAKLRTTMAEFMHYRFTSLGDPERDANRYIAWRHKRGDVVITPGQNEWVWDSYEYQFGEPVDLGSNLVNAYRKMHLGAENEKNDSSRIVAISQDPSESLFVMYWVHTHIWDDQPIISHPRGNDYWQGGKGGAFSTWFRCALEDPEMYTRVQVNLVAMAAVIVEMKDGSRMPMTMGFTWNTTTKDWMIYGMGFSNTDLAKVNGMVY